MKKILRSILPAACALLLGAGATSCLKYEKKANSSTTGSTTMVCDASFQNIMQQEVDVFEYQYPDAHILARYEPQSVALDSLMSLNTKTIVIARDLTDQEKRVLRSKKKSVKSAKIAVDAVALIVNKENPIEMLTVGEVADILSGSSRQWNDLEPSKLGEIAVIFDDKGSSLVSYMRDSLLNGGELGPNSLAVEMLSDSPVIGATLSDDIKVLKIRRNDEVTAYKPYQQNIFDGTYPLFRQIYMITTGVSGSLASGFYSFVTGETGQKIIMKTGILPARTRIQVVQLGDDE